MDSNEKAKKFNQVLKEHLADVYRISLYLIKDERLAAIITRRAFLTLYQQFENVHPELYLSYLVHYAKGLASEYQNGLGQ